MFTRLTSFDDRFGHHFDSPYHRGQTEPVPLARADYSGQNIQFSGQLSHTVHVVKQNRTVGLKGTGEILTTVSNDARI